MCEAQRILCIFYFGLLFFLDLAMLLVGCILYWLDKYQHVETVTGFWVIFVPFAPAVPWAIYMYVISGGNTFDKEKDI